MRIAVAASALLHLGLIVLTMIAWPSGTPLPPSQMTPSIPVDLVTVADETNIRAEHKAEKKKPKPPKEEPKPPKPKEPKPERKVAPPPPEPKAAEPEPEPEPAPKPPKKPEPKEKKPEKPKKPEKVAEAKPKPKPRKPAPKTREQSKKKDVYDQFAALLDKRPKEEEHERVFNQDGKDTPAGKTNREGVGLKTAMTVNKYDALKLQMQQCWNVDPGALNAGELQVDMVIEFNPDGTLRPGANNPRVTNWSSYPSNSYFRAAAEAAIMAVRECQGEGYPIPPNTSTVHVVFDPAKRLGGR